MFPGKECIYFPKLVLSNVRKRRSGYSDIGLQQVIEALTTVYDEYYFDGSTGSG